MIKHRVIGREVELADHAHRVVPRLDTCELDAGLGVKQFAAGQLRQKVKVPPGTAEFTVRRELQADRSLLVHDLFDLEVLGLAQVLRRYLALLELGTRLLDALWPQQAADLVGAEWGSGSQHDLQLPNS